MEINKNLSEKLVDKSIEAFILGLEVYNKPTIKYRIEGFSFFICNAWELMLKAKIINDKGEEAIYFKDSKERTISLENSIEKVFPNKNGGLRKNLIQIIKLRNTSTHFITEDYEHIYAPLFQACVNNYMIKLQEFHNKDITKQIAQNFLTLSVRLNTLTDEEIKAKYTPKMAEKLLNESHKIEQRISEANSDYAIQVKTNFYLTKRKEDADLKVSIDENSDTSVNIVKDVKDTNSLFPLTTKDVMKIVNNKLKLDNILILKILNNEKKYTPFNSYDFQLFTKFYDIKNNNKYCYHHKISNRYGYSQSLCDFIVDEIKKDPELFIENLKKGNKK